MRTTNWKKWIAGAMAAAMIVSSLPDWQVSAAETSAQENLASGLETEQDVLAAEAMEELGAEETAGEETSAEETAAEETSGEESSTEETGTEETGTEESSTEESSTEETGTEESSTEETETEESGTKDTVAEESSSEETAAEETSTEETATEENPVETVTVKVEGSATVEGVAEDGTALLGSEVSIKVLQAGYSLVQITLDEKGNKVYTAMELDYDNTYRFVVEEQVEFVIVNPELMDYNVLYSDTRKAKLTGTAGIKLNSLASSAQGYKEIVLNFTAVKNGSDGTETENVFYEVQVTAAPANEGEQVPAGSPVTSRYYYIPKTADTNTQSKSIQVNNGDSSASTAWNYEFSVRMVLISKTAEVPEEDVALAAPLEVSLAGNTLTKTFATKNLYYEDKLGFTKKTTKMIAGQQDVLVGSVKYSKNASYLHDLTAVAYDSTGAVSACITCSFKNDNDELYVSTNPYMLPGKYNVVVYAGVGEEISEDSPQSGTMYRATVTVALTIEAGITYFDTSKITTQVAVNNKDITFSAVPVGYGYGGKAKYQKFTYEIQSVAFDSSGNKYPTEPVDKVKNNISVDKKGKVKVKRGYYVDPDTDKNYFAVVIHAADYEGNDTTTTVYVEVVADVQIPTTIYLANSSGSKLGTTLAANTANWAEVIVLDQNGKNMNKYVTITPNDNAKSTAGLYVSQSSDNGSAQLYVRKPGTITIKATATNGSKKSTTLKVTVNKVTTSGSTAYYSLSSVTSDGFSASELTTGTGKVTYSAPRGAVIRYQQSCFQNSGYSRSWYDWQYEVTGGNLKFDGDDWVLTPTAQSTTVKTWLSSQPNRTWSLTFTNTNWGTTYDAAQKITLVDGKLYTTKYTNAADAEVYIDSEEGYSYYTIPDQELTYKYEYGSYTSVRIARISKSGPYLSVSDFDPENRTFKLTVSGYSTLKAGSYKYKVAFYRDGVLMSKPSTITVKVTKSSAVKVTSSYTLNTAQSDRIELKCSTKDFTPDFSYQLLNANVGGKANDFNKYFCLEYVTDAQSGEKKAVIKFKSTVTEEEKAALKGKSISGYVTYSYYYGYSHVENVTSKVTIKIK